MTLATRRQLLTGAAGVALEACIKPACLLHAQTQDVALPVSDAQIDVSAIETIIGRGDRLARVPVTLSVPTDHTLVVEYVTQNGAGTHGALAGEAVGDAHFITTRGQLIFQPGERNKFAEIQLLKPLRDGQSILLRIADFGYPRRNYVSRIGRVTSSDSPPAGPRFGQDLCRCHRFRAADRGFSQIVFSARSSRRIAASCRMEDLAGRAGRRMAAGRMATRNWAITPIQL